jgi:hypothetical protein
MKAVNSEKIFGSEKYIKTRSKNWTCLSPQSDPPAITTVVTIGSNTTRHRKLLVSSTLNLRSRRASTSPASLLPCDSSHRRRTLFTLPCNLIDLRSVGTLSRKTRTTMPLRHYMSFSPEPSSPVHQCPSSLVTLGLYTLSTPKAPTSLDQTSLRLHIATRGRNMAIGVHPSSGI